MAQNPINKGKEENVVEREERQKTLLEKSGFAQMMFDSYTAKVE